MKAVAVIYTAAVVETTATPVLEQLLGSRLRARALGWLLSHPGERYFVRQLAAILHEDSTNLSRELTRLEGMGIVRGSREGQQKYFRADQDCPIYPELRALVLKTAGPEEILRKALQSLAQGIAGAFLFLLGSLAAGRELAESEIALFISEALRFGGLVEALGPV